MANHDHLHVLHQGVPAWNAWRQANPAIVPDLSAADLREVLLGQGNPPGIDLRRADLRGARLDGADLRRANLARALLNGAHLPGANLRRANLGRASLTGATLPGADLGKTQLDHADLSRAIMPGVSLQEAVLVETNLQGTNLRGAHVYGVSAWELLVDKATRQEDLVFTARGDAVVTVDDLEVAQFVFLLIHNHRMRTVIDTVTSKAVLILGSFDQERLHVLRAMRDELRARDYLPMLFEWTRPENRNLVETVSILAHLARFVIADLTNPRSVPAELQVIVPSLPSVPVKPVILKGQEEYALFDHLKHFPNVLGTSIYRDMEHLLAVLDAEVTPPRRRWQLA